MEELLETNLGNPLKIIESDFELLKNSLPKGNMKTKKYVLDMH